MRWSLKWSSALESGFYYSLLEKGVLSEADREPAVAPFSFYVHAFIELSSCRQIGMTEGPIPFTAIAKYFEIFGDGDFDDFLYFIRIMDTEYLDFVRKQIGSASKTGKSHQGSSRRSR